MKRCKKAKARDLTKEIESIPISRRKLLGMREPMIFKEIKITESGGDWVKEFSEKYNKDIWVNQLNGEISWEEPVQRRGENDV